MNIEITNRIKEKYNVLQFESLSEIFKYLYENEYSDKELTELLKKFSMEDLVIKHDNVFKCNGKYYYSTEIKLLRDELKSIEKEKPSFFNFDFWKQQLVKQFNLNDVGEELLEMIIKENNQEAMRFIKNKFSQFYREEILDMFCENYSNVQIDKILKELGYEKLEQIDIEGYSIKVDDIETEEEI